MAGNIREAAACCNIPRISPYETFHLRRREGKYLVRIDFYEIELPEAKHVSLTRTGKTYKVLQPDGYDGALRLVSWIVAWYHSGIQWKEDGIKKMAQLNDL
ncbi:MAG TPA: hypothetical protein VIZ18_01555, partial [Ktedonobacteraceae bacterium]